MAKPASRLLITFIGGTDLKYSAVSGGQFDADNGQDMSPIVRLLTRFPGGLTPRHTSLLLMDDRPEDKLRERYCAMLEAALSAFGLAGMTIHRVPILLPKGPTDLNALYETVWPAIRVHARQASEVVFHISSGTPAMQLTLLLAANCLRLDNVRLFETSIHQDVLEVIPPYVLAAREVRMGERSRSLPRLPAAARKCLIPDTVIEDPVVEASFAALYKAATRSRFPPRLLIQGPTGSGKWHAAHQFAKWRGQETKEWVSWASPPDPPENSSLLIRHLDTWPQEPLCQLSQLAARRPDLAIAATFRTDKVPASSPAALASDGLRGAAHIGLPALGARSDVAKVGEALARQLGLADGKLKERFGADWLTDLYAQGLHDMKSLLATAGILSPGKHPEHDAYALTRDIQSSQAALTQAWSMLTNLEFGPGRSLEDVMKVIRTNVVRRAKAEGRSQQAVAELLGIGQSTVSDILKAHSQYAGLEREGTH